MHSKTPRTLFLSCPIRMSRSADAGACDVAAATPRLPALATCAIYLGDFTMCRFAGMEFGVIGLATTKIHGEFMHV